MLYEIGGFVIVAMIWGSTNPFIKQGTSDINLIKSNSRLGQFILELKYLLTNYKYILPMGLNQLGSVLYFLLLQTADMSLAVPLTNSLTFVFTALTGWCLNEQMPDKEVLFGVMLVLIGSTCLCLDKYL